MRLAHDFIFSGYGATSSGDSDGTSHLKVDERWQAVGLAGIPWRELLLTSRSTRLALRNLRGRASSSGLSYKFFWWVAWLRWDAPLDVSVVRPDDAWRMALAGAAPTKPPLQQIEGNQKGLGMWYRLLRGCRRFCVGTLLARPASEARGLRSAWLLWGLSR
jgi:hypothetical protein